MKYRVTMTAYYYYTACVLEHEGLPFNGPLAIGLSKMSDISCSDATGEVPHNFLMDITEAFSKAARIYTLRDHSAQI